MTTKRFGLHSARLVERSRRDVLRAATAGLSVMMGACGREQQSRPGVFSKSPGPKTESDPPTLAPPQGSGGAGGADAIPEPASSGLSALSELEPANELGVRIPKGCTLRIVAETGKAPSKNSNYVWHGSPDAGATFPLSDGGWLYVSNSELSSARGGVGVLRFSPEAEIVDAYSILGGSTMNCGGMNLLNRTWLSCEEHTRGVIHECDPLGKDAAQPRPAMGVFRHEGAALEPRSGYIYQTEDQPDGRFYRFLPDHFDQDGVPLLSKGTLEVAQLIEENLLLWHEVRDPEFLGTVPTRLQIKESAAFSRGEGIWQHDGIVFFSTAGDDRVWAYDTKSSELSVLYHAASAANPILTGVDTIAGSSSGDLLVAEDLGDMQIVAILSDGTLKPIVQVMGQAKSEITGVAFGPSGTRLYFNSQRGSSGAGITYELEGPFHTS